MEVTITLSESQANVVVAALDAYSRAMMGQLSWVANICTSNLRFSSPSSIPISYEIRERLSGIECLITGMSANGHFGISSPEVGETARIAFDIQQVLRHSMSWHKHPQGGHGVWFHEPLMTSTLNEPMPTVICR